MLHPAATNKLQLSLKGSMSIYSESFLLQCCFLSSVSRQNGSHRWLNDHDETVHGVITPNDIGTILSRRSPRLKTQNDIKAAALNLH